MTTTINPTQMPGSLKFLRIAHLVVAVIASLYVLLQLAVVFFSGTMFSNAEGLSESAKSQLHVQVVIVGLLSVLISGAVLIALWFAALTLSRQRSTARRWNNIYGISSLVSKALLFILTLYTTYVTTNIVKASVAEQNPLGYALSGGAVSANINAAMAQQLLLTVVTSILFAAYPIATLIIINRRPASEFLRGASPPHSTSTENPMR